MYYGMQVSDVSTKDCAFLSCLRPARTKHIIKLFSIVAYNPVFLPGSLLFLISKISAANSDEEHMSAPQSLP